MRNKKEIKIFIIVFILSIIIFINYLKGHYANDTYAIYNRGYIEYGTTMFLTAGRPFSYLLLLIAEFLNLSIEVLVFVSTFIGLFISCMSVMLIRKIIVNFKQPKNIFEDTIITMIAYCTIFNFMYIEMLHFAETAIMTLAVFMALFAAYQLINAKKYNKLKSFLLLLVAIFSYNGVAGIYVTTVVFLTILNNKKLKEHISYIGIAIVLLISSIVLNFIQIKIVTNFLDIQQSRLSLDIFNNIKYILRNLRKCLVM